MKEVVYLVMVSGRFDIMAEVICRDHEDLLKFITEKLYAIEGVREVGNFHAFEDRQGDIFLG